MKVGQLVVLAGIFLSATAMAERTYTNPVGGDIRMGDPFVLLYEGTYYLYGTAGRGGFLHWKSPNLVDWTPLGYATRRTEQTWGRGSFWAPEVIRYRDKFYMVYSCMREREQGYRLCLAVADSPSGPFVDLHAPWLDIGWSCIDGHIFVDDDGTPYVYFARVGVVGRRFQDGYLFGVIHGARLSRDLSKMEGDPVECVRASQPWEDPESNDTRCNEGPFVFKRGGKYYMTYSSGHYASPRYGIGYATAPSPLGPWTKSESNPLLATDPRIGVSGPGHSSITTSPDGKELFIVYHAHADPNRPGADRTVNIDRLVFDEQGNLKVIGPTRTPQPLPSGSP